MARSSRTRAVPVIPPTIEESHPAVAVPRRRFSMSTFVLAVLLLMATGVAGYFYWQYRHVGPVADAAEIAALQKTIGAVMELPEGETPTLATVTDKTKLSDQPFFQKAENGDKVLIYTNHGRAILYRPSTKKIIDVTAVNITPPVGTQTQTQNGSDATSDGAANQSGNTANNISTSLRVAIYNGSGENGAALNLEKQIHALYPDMTFPNTTDATNAYDDSRVVDLTGKNATLSQAFANLVKGTIRTLPEGEKVPKDADVLIILGKTH